MPFMESWKDSLANRKQASGIPDIFGEETVSVVYEGTIIFPNNGVICWRISDVIGEGLGTANQI